MRAGPGRLILAIGWAIASFLLECNEQRPSPRSGLSPENQQPDERGAVLPESWPEAALDAEDAAVFSAILSFLDSSPSKPFDQPARLFLVSEQTHYFQLSRDLVLIRDTLLSDPRALSLPQSLFFQFSQRNFRPQRLPLFPVDRPVALLGGQRWRQIRGSLRPAEVGLAAFPEAQGVYFLGLPGYSEDRFQALSFGGVVWQWLWGWGSLFYLEKNEAGSWEIRWSSILFRY